MKQTAKATQTVANSKGFDFDTTKVVNFSETSTGRECEHLGQKDSLLSEWQPAGNMLAPEILRSEGKKTVHQKLSLLLRRYNCRKSRQWTNSSLASSNC